ncbi:MAG: ABC transporter permease [Bacteroidales bacterium]|nr:ABC transporter permease [Bacteroidales bacterium]
MNTLKIAYRRLFRKGEHSITRVVSLSAGMAFGMLLLSEVFYYYSFDSFYRDADRLYVVHENFRMDKSSEKMESYPRVSGAIAPGLKAEVPGIESATRLNSIGSSVFYTDDKKSYYASFSLADEHLFDVLPVPMISGNPEEILKNPMTCMVSGKIAEDIGGNVIGKTIELKEYPGRKITISGVFEALPENTNYAYDVLISMISTGQFFRWDGSENWMGNDRYYAVVKLAPGVNPVDLKAAVRKMQVKYQDIEKMEEQRGGMVLQYSFEPIKKLYSSGVKDMILILVTIAFAVLFVSFMNYILLTLSVLIQRAKSSAIHKTCGAKAGNLQKLVFSETLLLFLISLAGAILLILLLRPVAEMQLGHKISAFVNFRVLWPVLSLILALVVITSYLPGRFFSRIPAAVAFRNYQQKKNKWKLALLSFQFAGAAFILTMLVLVSMQYSRLITADHGYRTKGIYYGETAGMESSRISPLLNELRALPGIEEVGLGCIMPFEGAPGNNIFSEDREQELFNIADFYYIDEHYLSILGISVVEGSSFSSEHCVANDLLISKKGAEKLKIFNGWKQVVGQQVDISEHGKSTIRGIFPDFIVNNITSPDFRPSVFYFYPEEKFKQVRAASSSFLFYILVKTNETDESVMMKKLTDIFNRFLPHRDAVIKNLETEQQTCYRSAFGFRNAMMAGNAVILLITIIGLLGYTSNEAARRRKELAIRRINGASLADILRIFILDLIIVAIPAVLFGLAGAWFTADKWMQNFAMKIPLHWGIFAICSLLVLILAAFVTTANYMYTASRCPAESLRYE